MGRRGDHPERTPPAPASRSLGLPGKQVSGPTGGTAEPHWLASDLAGAYDRNRHNPQDSV